MRAVVGVAGRRGRRRCRCSAGRPGRPALRRRVGYVTQAPSVYADLTVRENSRYFAAVLGAPALRRRPGGRRGRTWQPRRRRGRPALRRPARRGCRWPPRCSASPSCWCSTSRPSASTRCCAATCGSSSATSPTAATTLLVCSHVMDEAARCDRLLLLREGRLLADDTPHGLLARTGDRRRRGRVPRPGRRRARARAPPHEPRRTLATARRVLTQLRHDPAPSRLLLVVPCVLLACSPGSSTAPRRSTAIGAPLLGIFPFVVMFLVTSVATLRERTSGTLERLLTMPLGKLDLLLGYALAFGAVAVVQAAWSARLSLTLFGLDVAGPAWLLVLVAVARRGARHGARAVRQRVRGAPSSRPCSSCPRSCCRSSCSAGCWCRATRCPTCCTRSSRAAAVLRRRRHAGRDDARRGRHARRGCDLGVVAGAVVLALGLGAATLRRRTRLTPADAVASGSVVATHRAAPSR